MLQLQPVRAYRRSTGQNSSILDPPFPFFTSSTRVSPLPRPTLTFCAVPYRMPYEEREIASNFLIYDVNRVNFHDSFIVPRTVITCGFTRDSRHLTLETLIRKDATVRYSLTEFVCFLKNLMENYPDLELPTSERTPTMDELNKKKDEMKQMKRWVEWVDEVDRFLLTDHRDNEIVSHFFKLDSEGKPLTKLTAAMEYNPFKLKKIHCYEIRAIVVPQTDDHGVVVIATPAYRACAVRLKCVVKSSLQSDPDYAEKIKREVAILSRAHHPFIAPLMHSFSSEDHFYMVTNFYEGGPLIAVCHGLPMKLDAAEFLCHAVALAIEYLHQIGVVYSAIDAHSIVLDRTGYPVLNDFESAKRVREPIDVRRFTPEHREFLKMTKKDQSFLTASTFDFWSLGMMLRLLTSGTSEWVVKEVDYELYKHQAQNEELSRTMIKVIDEMIRGRVHELRRIKHYTSFKQDQEYLKREFPSPFLEELKTVTDPEDLHRYDARLPDYLEIGGMHRSSEVIEDLTQPYPTIVNDRFASVLLRDYKLELREVTATRAAEEKAREEAKKKEEEAPKEQAAGGTSEFFPATEKDLPRLPDIPLDQPGYIYEASKRDDKAAKNKKREDRRRAKVNKVRRFVRMRPLQVNEELIRHPVSLFDDKPIEYKMNVVHTLSVTNRERITHFLPLQN